MLTLDELRDEVESGAIDTVVVAFTDMQGRLLGKRLHAEFFLEENVAEHGIEGCNYLLALEMEMDPVPGYGIASWEQGYGDFGLRPDSATLRRIPWLEATALVLCDVVWHDGTPVPPSPRQVLKRQVERAGELGYVPMFGSELEFYLLRETYAEAHAKHYRDLTPSVPYILDYHILASTYDEPLIRQIRNGMQGAGIRVETRIPGGDVNPYLGFAALLAAGLHGIKNELELPPALEGNAYESDAERFPHSLREAIDTLESGTMARAALGDDVVDHYLNYARTEQRLFDEVVTCYERERMFERG